MTPLGVDLPTLVQALDRDLADEDAIAHVAEARRQARELGELGDQLIDTFVQRARLTGASWSQIGDAMGVTKQAAQQRAAAFRPGDRYNRFTQRARDAISAAHARAKSDGQPEVQPEHVLLELLAAKEGLAAQAVQLLGADPDAVASPLQHAWPKRDGTVDGQLPFSRMAKQLLVETIAAAQDLGHDYVGTEHLLLGVLRMPDTLACQALNGFGIDAGRVRDTIAAALMGLQQRPTNRG